VAGERHWSVKVEGATELANRLKRFDAEMYKILNDELKQAGDKVADAAKQRVPSDGLSNWGPWLSKRVSGKTGSVGSIQLVQKTTERNLSFNQGNARAGIKPRAILRNRSSTAESFQVQVQQMDPAGAIFELAGSRLDLPSGAKTVQAAMFRQHLNTKHGAGPWPRTLRPALYEKGTEAGDAIIKAVQAAMDRVNKSSSS
jgi:hypothetical protein